MRSFPWTRSAVALLVAQFLLATTAVAEAPEALESRSALQEITITAQRTAEAEARAAQKEAENIVNVIAFDEIRKLPVVNSGDAVRIIPGVQLETDTGEGRFVNIPGLDSDLSSTTFGGVRLPPPDVTTSPYGGSRAVSFDALPAEMIGAVTVTKTNRPEQEAEALGGTIEISPKTVPQSGKPYFGDVTVGSGFEPLRFPLDGYEPRPSEIRVNWAAARSVRNARSITLRTSRSTCAAIRAAAPGREGTEPGREGTDSRNGAMLLR